MVKKQQDNKDIAVIDLGSNTIRFCLFKGGEAFPRRIMNDRKHFLKLAEDTDAAGNLSPAKMDRAVELVREFSFYYKQRDVIVLPVATAAVRNAPNGQALIDRIARETGVSFQILSARDEAFLSATGVAAPYPKATGVVADLGGGSLEIIHINNGLPDDGNFVSLPFGNIALSAYKWDRNAAKSFVKGHLKDVPFGMKGDELFLVGGAFRAVARVCAHLKAKDLGLDAYPLSMIGGYDLARPENMKYLEKIAKGKIENVDSISGVSSRRKDQIAPCAQLALELIKKVSPKRAVVSAYGVREGVMHNMLNIRKGGTSMKAMIARLQSEISERQNYGPLYNFIKPTFEKIAPEMALPAGLDCASALKAVCALSEIGKHQEPGFAPDFVHGKVLNSTVPGISPETRAFLALATAQRYKGRKQMQQSYDADALLSPEQQKTAKAMGTAVNLAYRLTGGQVGLLSDFSMKMQGQTVCLRCESEQASTVLLNNAKLENYVSIMANHLGRRAEIMPCFKKSEARLEVNGSDGAVFAKRKGEFPRP